MKHIKRKQAAFRSYLKWFDRKLSEPIPSVQRMFSIKHLDIPVEEKKQELGRLYAEYENFRKSRPKFIPTRRGLKLDSKHIDS